MSRNKRYSRHASFGMYRRPSFVTENICNLEHERLSRNMTLLELYELTGIKAATIKQYEAFYYPESENYNKLAEVFGWQKWDEESEGGK